MQLLVTGGTGFIGRELLKSIRAHNIVLLTRNIDKAKAQLRHVDHGQIRYIHDLSNYTDFNMFDGIINLAGEPIADKRWSHNQKRRICNSRWKLTEQIVSLIQASDSPPKVLISGSAVGYYGDQQHDTLDESFALSAHSSIRDQFAHQVCHTWEEIALEAQSEQTRVCVLRTGVVLGRDGGALPKMSRPFQFGVGGHIGDGKQFLPWIHIQDMVQGIVFLLNNDSAQGPFNLSAPHPVSNAEFSRHLARILRRPYFLSVPAWVMKMAMGESASLVLDSCRARPKKLTEMGFNFTYSRLEPALKQLYSQ